MQENTLLSDLTLQRNYFCHSQSKSFLNELNLTTPIKSFWLETIHNDKDEIWLQCATREMAAEIVNYF